MAIAPGNHLKFDFARNASVILQEKVVKIYDVGQCLDCIREIAVKPKKKNTFLLAPCFGQSHCLLVIYGY